MTERPKILAMSGSLRAKSYTRRIVKAAAAGARAGGADVTYLDLNDYPLPIFNADLVDAEGFPATATELQKILLAHEGLLICSPEYNGSLSGALKNAIDWTSRANGDLKVADCYKGKFAAIMTASPGAFGGIRCLRHLRDVLTILSVVTLPTEIAVPSVAGKFDGDADELNDERTKATLENLGAALAAMLKKTRGRELASSSGS